MLKNGIATQLKCNVTFKNGKVIPANRSAMAQYNSASRKSHSVMQQNSSAPSQNYSASEKDRKATPQYDIHATCCSRQGRFVVRSKAQRRLGYFRIFSTAALYFCQEPITKMGQMQWLFHKMSIPSDLSKPETTNQRVQCNGGKEN